VSVEVISSGFFRGEPVFFKVWRDFSLFKDCFESLEDAKVVPFRRRIISGSIDGLKQVVIH
jgi:hypothetical protein